MKGGGRKISYLKAKWLHGFICFMVLAAATKPFFEANDLTDPNFFIFLIALICLVIGVTIKKIVRMPLLGVIMTAGLYRYFPMNSLFSWNWWHKFWEALLAEIAEYSLSTPFYVPEKMALCFIFLLVILLIVLFIDYEIWSFPYFIVVGYLLSLEALINKELLVEIMIMTACTFTFVLFRKWDQVQASKTKKIAVMQGLLILMLTFSFASLLPSFFEDSHDRLVAMTMPVRSHLNSQGFYGNLQQYRIRGTRSSGFSDNDRHLGGPILDNHDLVFIAYQEAGYVWRVETKGVYTGGGWDEFEQQSSVIEELPYEIRDVYLSRLGERSLNEAIVVLEPSVPFIPLPYGQVLLSPREGESQLTDGHLYYNSLSNRLILDQRETDNMNEFVLSVRELEYTLEDLQNEVHPNENDEILAEYLQLPATLPSRIAELAAELTSDLDTYYEQVVAIEAYLKTSGNFRYSKTDASFIPEGRDYVDYFLFDTQVGYCDNFSTAMVIMLRTLGIPARWAKGFTQGNQIELTHEEYNQYEVLNSHAHSWPEVYFSGIGWVPFEPTPSFVNAYQVNALAAARDLASDLEEDQEVEATLEELEIDSTLTDSTENLSDPTHENADRNERQAVLNIWPVVVALLMIIALMTGIMGVVVIVFIFKNFHWLSFMLYMSLWARDFEETYKRLLNSYRFFEARLPGESLADYARRIEHKSLIPIESFLMLTNRYEASLYGDKQITLSENKPLFKEAAKLLYQNLKFGPFNI